MDIEDIQDIDALSITSSVSSSISTTSQKVFKTFLSGWFNSTYITLLRQEVRFTDAGFFAGLSYPQRKLSQLLVPEVDFEFTFPSLENVFPS